MSNGVDLDVYSPGAADESLRRRYALPAGRPLIVSVGRLSPEKRADVLIEALAAQDVADTVLALAGSGPDEGRLRELAARRGVAERVRFLGFIPGTDLPGLYRLADVFAIASEAELQSLVTMEAMASGLAHVARDGIARARGLPNGAHHAMTLVGVVAYYLSAPTAADEFARPLTAPLRRELTPLITPTLALMRAWRLAKRMTSLRGAGR